jgi:hypothetical protein
MKKGSSINFSRYAAVGLFILTAIFFGFINLQMPLVGEDYTLQPWGFHAAPASFFEQVRAISHKVYYSAVLWSPRIGEALTTITAAFPKIVFDILNTVLFLWLIILLFVIAFGRFPKLSDPADDIALFVSIFLIIVLFPLLGLIFFWKAGTANHIWGLVVLLSFTLPFRLNFRKRIHIKNIALLILFFFLGFFAGLTVENASAVILVTLLVYFVTAYVQKKIDGNFLFPLISFTIAVFILLFSPSTTIRRAYYDSLGYDGNLSGLALYINRFNRISTDFIKITWPLLAVFIICLFIFIFLVQRKFGQSTQKELSDHPPKSAIREIITFAIISYISVPILMGISYQSDQRRGFALFWLIIISSTAWLISQIWRNLSSSWRSIIVILPMALLILQMVKTGSVYTQFSQENNTRMTIIYAALEHGDKNITLPAITIKDSRILETREVLPDLGQRLATYFGLKSVEIEK